MLIYASTICYSNILNVEWNSTKYKILQKNLRI